MTDSTDDAPSILAPLWFALSRLGLIALTAFCCWLPGLVWYVSAMPEAVHNPDSQTDVIVVLTGGSERLRVGLDLLKQGKAPLLFISGVNPETTLDALLAEEDPLPTGLRNRILLGHVASDTVGNAIETAVWMRAHHMNTLRLVTASYHMPRSLLEFQAALPRATIIPHPVFPRNVKQSAWWSYPGTAELFISEYNKYLVAALRLQLPDAPPEAGRELPTIPSDSLPPLARVAPPPHQSLEHKNAPPSQPPLQAQPIPALPPEPQTQKGPIQE